MVDRANAFRQHHDLFQQKEYKGVNLYVQHILHLLVSFSAKDSG
jgi:hypothetical protein